jgi:hypothetical protein
MGAPKKQNKIEWRFEMLMMLTWMPDGTQMLVRSS